MSPSAAYQLLAEQLTAHGLDVSRIKDLLKAQQIETPSWGYANSGTRFKVFAWPGAAVTTHHKLADNGMVHGLTGVAPSVAIHIPWDKPEHADYAAMQQVARSHGVSIGAVNPNVFQGAGAGAGCAAGMLRDHAKGEQQSAFALVCGWH